MFQKEIFGPKNQDIEEIVVNFPKDAFSFPNKEIFEENNASSSNKKKKTIMSPKSGFPYLRKRKILSAFPKSK